MYTLTVAGVLISGAKGVSMVTVTCVVAGSVGTDLVAQVCAQRTFINVCVER